MEGNNEWKSRYESLLMAFNRLEAQSKQQAETITFLTQQLANADKAVEINKNLLRMVTEEHNKKELDMVYYMNKLKDKLREFGYADFNRLGE